jgi:DnaK suppressor protein
MPSIPVQDLNALASTLRQQRADLAQALHTRTHQGDAPDELAMTNFYDSTDDRAEAASLNENDVAQLNHDAQSLRQIDAALRRIDDGSYGDCAGCGAAIATARLLAEPSATLCLACQAQAEQAARR